MRASTLLLPSTFAETVSNGEFQRPPHIQLIEREVFRVLFSDHWDVLVAMCPPRHGKTFYLSRWFPAWYFGVYAQNNVILTSYGKDLARTSSRWVKDATHKYAPIWKRKGVNRLVSAATDWQTVEGGGMLAAGIGGGITGRPANVFLIDDILKNAEQATSSTVRDNQWEWFQSTALTRLEPGGKIIVLATRWHSEDLLGRILKFAQEGDSEHRLRVREIRLPALAEPTALTPDPLGRATDEALWPARYNTERLKRLRASMDDYWFSAIFQQRLGTYGKNEWPEEYFWGILAQDDEWPEHFDLLTTAADPSKGKDSKKGDYQAIVSCGYKNSYLWFDADINRRPVPTFVEDLVQWNVERRPLVTGIESVQFQELLCESYRVAQIKYNYLDDPEPIQNSVAKNLRIARIGLWLRFHKVKIRNTQGGRLLIKQLKEFPNCDHDDGPDAMEMSIRLMLRLSDELQSLSSDGEFNLTT